MRLLLRVVVALVALVFVPFCAAGTVTVGTGTSGSCTDTNLASAIAGSSPGDTINFNCGGATTITFSAGVWIEHSLTIDGGDQITFDGNGNVRPLILAKKSGTYPIGGGINCTIQNLVITNGVGDAGTGTSVLDSATSGGGIYAGRTAVVHLNKVTITNCSGLKGGAIYFEIGCTVNIQNSEFSRNFAADSGGAIYVSWRAEYVVIFNVLFNANVATATNGDGNGGALFFHETRSLLQRVQFRDNKAVLGAGVHNLLADLELQQCVFSQGNSTVNPSDSRGGGVYIDGALRNDLGGNLANGGTIRIANTSFENNLSDGKGAGLYICIYSGSAGGGSHNDHSYIEDSRYCANSVIGGSEGYGAAIQYDCSGTMAISSSLFGGNTVPANPGSSIETFFPSGSTSATVASDTVIPGYTAGVPSPGTACAAIYDGKVGPAYNYGTPGQFQGGSGSSSSASRLNALLHSLFF